MQLRNEWTVLIIEDKPLIAADIEQVALDLGAARATVMRPEGALRAMLLSGPEAGTGPDSAADIVVVDYRSANEGARHLLDLMTRSAAFVIVTTTDPVGDADRRLGAADLVLTKPVSSDNLRSAFRTALDGRLCQAV